MFSVSERRGTAHLPSRSSGTKQRPRDRLRLESMRPAGIPQTCTEPPSWIGSSPEMAQRSSCWPLPETPAMPTISPLCTSRFTFLSTTPKGSSGIRERFSRRNRTSPPPVGSPCWKTGRSSPIIMRAMVFGVSCEGAQVPVTRPARSTVALWQSSWISSSLWLM